MTPINTEANIDACAPAATASYAAAYARLSAIATKLRAPATSTTIDTLAEDVRSAREAYGLCRARLEAIRREVDAAIGAGDDTTAA